MTNATTLEAASVTQTANPAEARNGTSMKHLDYIGYFSLSINLVAIVAGNMALLVFVNSRPKCRMTYFITNLGVSDLCVGLFCVLPQFIDRVLTQFYGPEILCKLKFFSQTLVSYGAAYALVALSIDRVDAIANPLRASTSRRKRQTACLIAGSWILSAVYSSPILIWTRVRQHSKFGRQCSISYGGRTNATSLVEKQNFWQIFVTANLVTIIIIPVTIVAVCHVLLIVTIYRSGRVPKSAGASAAADGTGGNSTECRERSRGLSSGGASVNRRNTITRAKVKTVKVTCTIVSVFILCWLPYTIGNFLDIYHVTRLSFYVKVFIQTLGTLNSAANPIIFFIFNYNQCCTRSGSNAQNNNNNNNKNNKQNRSHGPRCNYQMVVQQHHHRHSAHHMHSHNHHLEQVESAAGDHIGNEEGKAELCA